MDTATPNANRLSVFYLLSVTAGVGIAITVSRGIERLRFPADAVYYRLDGVADIDSFGMFVAGVYGVCLTTFFFAWRSGDIWSSPGKIVALLFASMCVINWTLDLFVALVMHYRMQEQLAAGISDTRGYIAGIWYRSFAPAIGYVVGLPVLAMVVYKTRHQRLSWRIAWMGFLLFAILTIGFMACMRLGFAGYVSLPVRLWYFEVAIGIPIVLLALALAGSLVRRERVDWWTAVIVPMIIVVWGIQVVLKATGT